ncbi:hypothetical protein MLD38_000211 [Melastoma candidum]|uniref:Uncharacterized protein n=1 Tax=Melastoma candidum TaxID=119954 RepID=A0ACB9S9H0_9MYRT|nr:hypothetical protein MLD38_000211 [Melastoma candidum]
MDQRRDLPYDVTIFGASGFTGKYVIREALKFLGSSPSFQTLALAGRSSGKLAESLGWACSRSGSVSPPKGVSLVTADVGDPDSLRRMCEQSKIVVNCVGPFRKFGEPVVAACVEAGCDYLDICGEPEFMERMEAKYHERAKEAGSLVISACGFDSVPAELGLMFNSRQWVEPTVVNRIEACVHLVSDKKIVGNFGTYESAVLGVANAKQLQELRRSRPKRARPVIPGPPPPKGPIVEHQKNLGLWTVKLPSADAVVVRRSLSILTENPDGLAGVDEDPAHIEKRKAFWSTVKPAHFGVRMGQKSLPGIFAVITLGIFIGVLGNFSFGRWLLLKFPSFFSLGWFKKKGPTEDEVESASFNMWFVAHGYSNRDLLTQGRTKPDMEITTRVTGPEVGYLATPIIIIQCALILLSQRGKLPKGGVFPPGIIFGPTDLQERLQSNGITFEAISQKFLSA